MVHFGLSKKTGSGWYTTDCPFCGKERHFGIKFHEEGEKSMLAFNCYKCGSHGSTIDLLDQIDRLDLLKWGKSIEDTLVLFPEIDSDESENLQVPDILLPFGFTRCASHPYLDSRGFEDWQYHYYNIGFTTMVSNLKDYVIFMVEENGIPKGFLGRVTWTREYLKEYNEWAKANNQMIKPKYNNSVSEFGKLLMGIDEVSSDTKTVILVEGVTDKSNVDKLLRLDQQPTMKCLCSFGKKVSIHQMLKMKMRGVEEVILMYDPDAVASMKEYGMKLSYFFDTKVAVLSEGDPGDLQHSELLRILANLKRPQEVYSSLIDLNLNFNGTKAVNSRISGHTPTGIHDIRFT